MFDLRWSKNYVIFQISRATAAGDNPVEQTLTTGATVQVHNGYSKYVQIFRKYKARI